MTDKHIEIVMKDAVNDCKVGELWSHYTRGKESSDCKSPKTPVFIKMADR